MYRKRSPSTSGPPATLKEGAGPGPDMLLVWMDELRMQEMVSMGIGNKPFMDIQPSKAAISDRAVKKGAGNVASALPLTLSH
ncbi:hypothetical protein GH733_018831 [Mirounga leonina]|nr:hypothetical protein GH733_018831 [Mirounga leonina]